MTDAVCAFQVDGAPVRGRITRLSAASIDPILRRHAYPRAAALLLGEALTLAALIGSLLKTAHALTIQAEGDGPAPLLVAQWRRGGGLRGYARIKDPQAIHPVRMAPKDMIGAGSLAITLDQGPDTDTMQGLIALDAGSLETCAETYFQTSEQTPTRIRLAVGEVIGEEGSMWQAGGALLQRVAGDDARGDTEDAWERAQILFATVEDAELIDPNLTIDRLLYRLFHEDGVRMGAPDRLHDECTCNTDRLRAVLGQYAPDDLNDLRDDAGRLRATCQFCARVYDLDDPGLPAGSVSA